MDLVLNRACGAVVEAMRKIFSNYVCFSKSPNFNQIDKWDTKDILNGLIQKWNLKGKKSNIKSILCRYPSSRPEIRTQFEWVNGSVKPLQRRLCQQSPFSYWVPGSLPVFQSFRWQIRQKVWLKTFTGVIILEPGVWKKIHILKGIGIRDLWRF